MPKNAPKELPGHAPEHYKVHKHNNLLKLGMKNVSYVMLSQIILYAISLASALFLPNILGAGNNAMWQTYLLYFSYVGFFHFGFCDGIYLRYGSYEYSDLPREGFRSMLDLLLIMETVMFALVTVFILVVNNEAAKDIPYIAAASNIVIMSVNTMYTMVNQITNRMKIFAVIQCIERVIFISIILALYATKTIDYKTTILADLTSRLLMIALNFWFSRELVFGKRMSYRRVFPEFLQNIKVGSALMLANFMGILLLGLGRIVAEQNLPKEVFGTYGVSLSLVSMILVFIQAISLVLYPILKRTEQGASPRYFLTIDRIITAFSLVILLAYYPALRLIWSLMPQYRDMLDYLVWLFPIIFFQSKIQLVFNTFMKALRQERILMVHNIISLVVLIAIGLPVFNAYHNIESIIVVTLVAFAVRNYLSDIYMRKKLKLEILKPVMMELLVLASFILGVRMVKGTMGFFVFFITLAMYLVVEKSALAGDIIPILQKLSKKKGKEQEQSSIEDSK